MLLVLSRARAAPGAREGLVAAAVEMAQGTRRDAGCLAYTFAADLEDPDVIVCTEVWTGRDALDAHMSHPHTAAFLGRVGNLTDGEPEMTFHTTTD